MAFLQDPDRVFLGFILDEALVFNGVLPGTEGRVESHAREYATADFPLLVEARE
jgi:hypothetical protein